MSDFKKKIEEEWNKQTAELQKANIMIVGGTGVGKSALINYIFGENVAEEGAGKPITEGMIEYEPDGIPIVLIDTEGYEISKEGNDTSNFRNNILPEIEEYQGKELKEQIHLAWYCISISNNRITDFDIENIKIIQQYLPKRCAIVLTQCDNDEEDENGNGVKSELFKKILRDNDIQLDVFETSTNKDAELALDIEELVSWSSDSLPEDSLKHSFVASQKCSIAAKYELALKHVTGRAIAASGAGAAPIPFSDAPIIAGIQIEMAIKIASIFGVSSMGDKALTLLKTQIASTLGKTLAAQLTKYIPILGSAINAAIAGAITYGLGFGLIKIFEKAQLEYLETGKEPDWYSLFSSDLLWDYVKKGFGEWKNSD